MMSLSTPVGVASDEVALAEVLIAQGQEHRDPVGNNLAMHGVNIVDFEIEKDVSRASAGDVRSLGTARDLSDSDVFAPNGRRSFLQAILAMRVPRSSLRYDRGSD